MKAIDIANRIIEKRNSRDTEGKYSIKEEDNVYILRLFISNINLGIISPTESEQWGFKSEDDALLSNNLTLIAEILEELDKLEGSL